MAPEEITNADDVIVTVNGASAGPNGHCVVDSFEYSDETETELISGCGSHMPKGVTKGNATAELTVTFLGESAGVMNSLAPANDGTAPDCHVTFVGEKSTWNITHFWPTERNFSGDDGDAVEYEASGVCFPIDDV